MKTRKVLLLCAAFVAATIAAKALPVTGTVKNMTTGQPSAGDRVSVVDVQAGMQDVERTTTDANGRFSINTPGPGPYLLRVDHQGAGYFAAAPQNTNPVTINVYDVAEKVEGITIEADVIEAEADNGQLSVEQQFFIKNLSSPPRTQFSKNTFEFTLPEGAVLDGVTSSRPAGLPTTNEPDKLAQKGHYAINVPIEPNRGTKGTIFDVHYHLPYKDSYTFTDKQLTLADNIAVLLPKQMTFKSETDGVYQSVSEDPRLQTFVLKNPKTGQKVGFTVSGTGQLPRDQQGRSAGPMGGADQGAAGQPGMGSAPGGGIGNPNEGENPLAKYQWYIIGGLVLILFIGVFILLRRSPAKQADEEESAVASESSQEWSEPAHMAPTPSVVPAYTERITPQFQSAVAQPAAQVVSSSATFLNALKDELFSIETDKLNGLLSDNEYGEAKFAIDVLLKRTLKKG